MRLSIIALLFHFVIRCWPKTNIIFRPIRYINIITIICLCCTDILPIDLPDHLPTARPDDRWVIMKPIKNSLKH